MADDKKHIVFRRIRGRVVPIRLDSQKLAEKRGNIAKGAGAIVGGLGISAIAGKGAAKMVEEASALRMTGTALFRGGRMRAAAQAAGQSTFKGAFRGIDPALTIAKGIRQRWLGQKLFANRNKVLLGGAALGAAAIGYGIHKIAKETTDKETQKKFKTDQAAAVLGASAAAIASAIYYKHLGLKGLKNNIIAISRKLKGVATGTNVPIKHRQGTFRFMKKEP